MIPSYTRGTEQGDIWINKDVLGIFTYPNF